MVVHGPIEGDGEEWKRFWNDMNRIVDRIGNGYRLSVLEDMNGWVGVGITGDFGVPR